MWFWWLLGYAGLAFACVCLDVCCFCVLMFRLCLIVFWVLGLFYFVRLEIGLFMLC